ncbi:MAG: hypothetical protein MSG64_06085 [Pyrinomonadaceae bacterium MAG19_C2-C3]|nr:hypothetical protein [Pyrinomonadaceae bacterium MAG19_C2-C3]
MNDTNTGNGNPDNGDERRQRQMDFILEQQAQFSVDIQLLKEAIVEQKEASIAQKAIIDAHTEAINAQAAYSAAEFGRVNERMNRFENLLYASLEGQESLRESQKILSQDVRLLKTSVDRITDAVAFLLEERKRNGSDNS